jgi:hypothetical protein
MKNCPALAHQTMHRILRIACATALAVVFMAALPQPVGADKITPPPMPSNLQVPEGNKTFLTGHAVGTQNYICLPSSAGFAWAFLEPQATLFNDGEEQIITHFLSPNPFESDTPRATTGHMASLVIAKEVALGADACDGCSPHALTTTRAMRRVLCAVHQEGSHEHAHLAIRPISATGVVSSR